MSDVHTMYEELIRSIDRNMAPLVALLLGDEPAPTAAEDTSESPVKVDGKSNI